MGLDFGPSKISERFSPAVAARPRKNSENKFLTFDRLCERLIGLAKRFRGFAKACEVFVFVEAEET